MKKPLFGCLLALAGMLVSVAQGQVVVQPNGVYQNPLTLLENKDAQKDLELSDEQSKKIDELSRKHTEGLKGLGFQDIEKRKKVLESTQKGLAEVLTPRQTQRWKQLELQQRGANAFLDPQVTTNLTLTREQQAVVTKVLQGMGSRWVGIIQTARGNQQEIQKKLGELHRELLADIVKGLTAEQQTKWRELTGTPFAGVFPAAAPVVGLFQDPRPQPTLKWIMNDLAAAQEEAAKTGKPIFVTFRCEA